jgi:RNA polymerase sigma-70 factor (ECF subfamily)
MIESQDEHERAIQRHWAAGANQAAASLLLATYGREILRFIASRLRDPELTADVFSQFTEDLWRSFDSFGFRCSARVWAYTLARHASSRVLKVAQRERRRHVPLSEAGELGELAERIRTETLPLLRTETKTRMAALRERLSEEDQQVLLLRVNRKLEWREIAQVMLGCDADEPMLTRETARLRKRFQLAKQQLRGFAEAEGLLGHIDESR